MRPNGERVSITVDAVAETGMPTATMAAQFGVAIAAPVSATATTVMITRSPFGRV